MFIYILERELRSLFLACAVNLSACVEMLHMLMKLPLLPRPVLVIQGYLNHPSLWGRCRRDRIEATLDMHQYTEPHVFLMSWDRKSGHFTFRCFHLLFFMFKGNDLNVPYFNQRQTLNYTVRRMCSSKKNIVNSIHVVHVIHYVHAH